MALVDSQAHGTTDGFSGKNHDTIGWVFGPDTRGTIDIIYGCIVVLVTAIWTVIHLNIPAKGDSGWRILLRRIRWGRVSIFAPDFLTLVAAAQWDSAQKSVAQMRLLPELRDNNERWCLEHAFYANSGGFLLQCPDVRPFPINAASMHHLVSKGYIRLPDISRDEVWDKSKADVFAKGFAILQGAWIIVGSIARAAQHLPLSPLELFTLAFVVSTAMSYFFWWRKPQNVTTPTILICKHSIARIRTDAGLPAAGYDRTPMDFVEKPLQTWQRRELFRTFDLESSSPMGDPTSLQGSVFDVTSDSIELKDYKFNRKPSEGDYSLDGYASPRTQISQSVSEPADSRTELTLGSRKDSEITLIGQRLNDLPSPQSMSSAKLSPLQEKSLNMVDEMPRVGTMDTPAPRIPDDAIMPTRLPIKVLGSLMLPSMVHSCIHLLGWNLDYPTDIEKQLWRASAITLSVMSCIAVGAVRVLAITGYKGRYNLVWFWVNSNFETKRTMVPEQYGIDVEGKSGPRSLLERARQAMALGGGWRDLTFWDCFLGFATLALVNCKVLHHCRSCHQLQGAAKGCFRYCELDRFDSTCLDY